MVRADLRVSLPLLAVSPELSARGSPGMLEIWLPVSETSEGARALCELTIVYL